MRLRRLGLIATLALGIFLGPLAGDAQQRANVARIGVLGSPTATSGDAVGTGLVASLARPGGNTTGSSHFSPEITAKRLELLKEAIPRVRRVAVLMNQANPLSEADFKQMGLTAQALGIEVRPAWCDRGTSLTAPSQRSLRRGPTHS